MEDVKSKMSCLQVSSIECVVPDVLLTRCPQVKVQVDTIVRVLAASSLHWVVCLQPHPLAGLCELFRRPPGRSASQKLLRDQVMRHRSLLLTSPGSCRCGGCSCWTTSSSWPSWRG